ncbi:MAG TPA: 50S ribosomal protein L15 [Candidatus Bathyarchaeota archaeon]|nr:50S ribosomal protein L15 [Candidatus Bathyarchaeota archaeon]HEX69328.1 50S ribosomal protein L15 [Candidatus Bathyarchaeota archaeon]
MPHKLRKIRKKRGSRTCGYGRVGQHRKSGTKGERRAGRHKHLWSYVIKYEPDYFGKRGFTSPRSLQRRDNPINLSQLDELVEKLIAERKIEKKNGKPFVDLKKLGYTKLLGMGKISKPVIIKVPAFSSSAAEKIEAIGGQILKE